MEPEKFSDEQAIQLGKKAIQRLKEAEKNQKWEKFSDKPCQMFKMQNDGRVAAKGQATIKISIDKIHQFLAQEPNLKILDTQMKEINVLKVLNDDNSAKIIYMQFHGIWPVSNRDFVCVSYTVKEGDTIYITTQSCDFPHPEKKGIVRGKITVGGYVLKKIDDNTTFVAYVSDTDLCGSIPGMVKKELAKKQGVIVSKIEDAMKKK